MPLYVVDTILTYRMRYIIDAKEVSHAEDTVVMQDSGNSDDFINEFSQKYLGETIIESREITLEEFYEMNNNLNRNGDSGSPWMGTDMIHKINYD